MLTSPPVDSLLTRADEYTLTDMFGGAGGEATGIAMVPGVRVVTMANHWQLAIDVHQLNHPDTDHACVDLHQEDPRFFTKTDILWASPECTKWSQANGSDLPDIEADLFTDVDEGHAANQSRLLMFDVLRYIEHHRYRRVVVENVVDIAVSAKYRNAWLQWRKKLVALGYEFEVVSLNSMHAQFGGLPAPQSRDRLYIIAWPKGDVKPDVGKVMRPKAWCPKCCEVVESQQAWKPGRTVGRYRAQYVYVDPACGTTVEPAWLPAAAAIDWSIQGERIGDRKKQLEAKTRKRIAAGIRRYWLQPQVVEAAGNTYDAADPKHRAHGDPDAYYRSWPIDEVFRTLHTTESKALAVPVEGREGPRARPVEEVGRTQTTRAETALVTRQNGIKGGDPARHTTPATEYLRTLTTTSPQSLLELPFIAELRGGGSDARPTTEPLATFCASGNHHGLVEPPFILERRHEYRTRGTDQPLATLTANDTTKALITSAGGTWNDESRSVWEALRTLTTRDAYALLAPYYSSGSGETCRSAMDALGALTTHDRYALVQRHNSGGAEMLTPVAEPMRTLTTAGHQSVVTPGDMEAAEAMVDDCLFRMLRPHEVAVGMAFPRDYRWQPYDHRVVSNRDLVKMAGNAVTPPAARDLMYAVVESLDLETQRRRRRRPIREDMAA